MVDAVVSFVVQRLGDYLIQEAVFLRGVRDEVQLLKNQLEWMQCFIKDAEEKQVEDPMIRKWVSDIRDIAYDTEDVLDTFMLQVKDAAIQKMLGMREGQTSKRILGFIASVKKCPSLFKKGKGEVNLYSIGKEIEALRKRIDELSRIRELYGLQIIGNYREERRNSLGRLKQLRRATSSAVEEIVVGFKDDADILLAKLLEKKSQRFLISIFGMGGLGKTTLARKLYHNDVVRKTFGCFAWVSVSQDYNTKDLLLRIIESFQNNTAKESFMRISRKEMAEMTEENLERYMYKCLQGCSYLLVIDDVWKKEAWESLKRAFPNNKNGSRVIMTTRIKEVAERSDENTYAHNLRYLRPDESWQLFCEKTFRNIRADAGLKKLGREMVEKCGGLPLAIVVLGGLLAAKSPHEWHVVYSHIWRYLKNDSIHISHLLSLSFNDLPHRLKLCFLYLGLFPEDSHIEAGTIIRLLVAEGFVLQDEDRLMEEVAKDNLDALINRSLIQAGRKWLGMVQTYQVHDLLRDLALEKAKELDFIRIYDESKHPSHPAASVSSRRQAVYSETKSFLWLHLCNPLARSLLLFNKDLLLWESRDLEQSIIPLCARFRLLRVLNLKGTQRVARLNGGLIIPKEIEKLIHLKYLALIDAPVDGLPPSVGNLRSLQTIDLSNHLSFMVLPTKICQLHELRHLMGNFGGTLAIENLTKLQTLECVDYESWMKINPEKLVNLRKLCIQHLAIEELEYKLDSVAKLKSLQYLGIKFNGDCSLPSLQPLSHCKYLSVLVLEGKVDKIAEGMHEFLPKLERLSLKIEYLKNDPMPVLEKLPNLVFFKFSTYSYSGKKLVCKAKGFPRLETLELEFGQQRLEEWQVEEGAMPMLKGLTIDEMNKLMIPERLRSISS